METLYIPILEGTSRPNRESIKAARFVAAVGKSIEGVEIELIDPESLNFPHDGRDKENKDPRYTQRTKRADAFFIVTPEYNHAFPGSLKRMLDSELENYKHKPIAFAGVSVGPWGGVRAIEALVPSVREMGLIASAIDVNFPFVATLFNEDGTIKDKNYVRRVREAFDELIWLARTLKWGREQKGK